MKNAHIVKLGAVLAIISLLFMPVAGCGGMTFNGIDLLKMEEMDFTVKIFVCLAIAFALIIIFLKKWTQAFIFAIGGMISLIIGYMIAKGDMDSNNDFSFSDAFELKSGSYFSMIGFAISAIVSRIKTELFDKKSDISPE